jgi:hypothetical protein
MSELDEAQDPNTPPARLRVLAQRDLDHAKAVAKNPAAPPEVLQQFVETFNQDPDLIRLVISNPNTPTDALVRYGWSVPEALLQNPMFPILLLEDPLIIENIPRPTLEKILTEPDVPAQFLERHAGHTNPYIQAKIASHPKTPLASLQMLLEKEFDSNIIMSSLAENPNLSLEMLEKLATHPYEYVLTAVGEHPETPTHILAKLSRSAPIRVLRNIAEHPNTDLETLERLSHEEDDEMALRIAQRHLLPRSILERLAGYHNGFVHGSIFINQDAADLRVLYYRAGASDLLRYTKDEALKKYESPDLSLPIEELEALSKGLGYAKCLVASHPNTTLEILQKLATDPNSAVRGAVVGHPKTTEELREKFATDPNEYVRGAVARLPQTTAKVLLFMKKEPHAEIREQLAKHPNTPLELFWSLASDRELDVKLAVASYPKTPEVILKYLFEKGSDPKGHTKKAIAKNAGLDKTWLLALAKSRDNGIRLAVSRNPSASPEILAILSTDKMENVRYAVAQHRNVTKEILTELSQDESAKVSTEAKKNLNCN